MKFVDSFLPWTGALVRRCDHIAEFLSAQLSAGREKYLPAFISLFVDPEIGDADVARFLDGMSSHLRIELERRNARKAKFLDLRLLAADEIESFLTRRTDVQRWALYYSAHGGLGGSEVHVNGAVPARGVIPCSSMRNHGVAWQHIDGEVRTWLATSRRPGEAWDWESDIGHESAHAAFAHVPLFVQSNPKVPDNLLATAAGLDDLTPMHVAQIIYLWSEIAVVAFRGEPRPTATGLPVAQAAELHALLRLSALLSNDAGFERAAVICEATNGTIDVNHGDDIYHISAPILRILPHVTRFVNDAEPPPLSVLQDALLSTAGA